MAWRSTRRFSTVPPLLGHTALRGAWYTSQGLEYVVDDAGPPLLMVGDQKKVARDMAENAL